MSRKRLKVETCKPPPAGKPIRNQTWCELSWQRVKGTALLFLGKRDIKRIHPPRLRSVYPAAIWQRKNRVCSAPSFPRLGHRSAHPTHSILRTPYMRPDAAECSISARVWNENDASRGAELCWQRKRRKTPRKSGSALTESHTVCLPKHQRIYGPNAPANH